MKCKYKYEFPVDEFGRPGAMYSLADLPVVGYKVLERVGTLKKRDSAKKLYELKDDENNWTLVVPFDDVEIITSPLTEVI